MFPIVSVLLTLGLAFLVVRVATVALTLTGLSKESARFQARSAFTGVGFTTSEAENIVNHPVRRRIIMILMMLGNAGLVTVAASLMLTFVGQDGKGWLAVGLLFAGIALLILVSRSAWVERRMSTVIEWALRKWTHIDTQDYASLLRLSNGFSVAEFSVQEGDFVHGKSLLELPFKENSVIVLGIQRRNGSYIGAPGERSGSRPGTPPSSTAPGRRSSGSCASSRTPRCPRCSRGCRISSRRRMGVISA